MPRCRKRCAVEGSDGTFRGYVCCDRDKDHDGRHSGTLAGRERPFTWRQMGRIPDDLWVKEFPDAIQRS